MADAGQMHANLVRAAGANAHLKQRELLETSQHLVIGDRGAAIWLCPNLWLDTTNQDAVLYCRLLRGDA
jgi:hypothetical protein